MARSLCYSAYQSNLSQPRLLEGADKFKHNEAVVTTGAFRPKGTFAPLRNSRIDEAPSAPKSGTFERGDNCLATLSRRSDAIGRFSEADIVAAKAFDSNWVRLRERP